MAQGQRVRASLRNRVGLIIAVSMAVGAAGAGSLAIRHLRVRNAEAALREGQAVLDALSIPVATALRAGDLAQLGAFADTVARTGPNDLVLLACVDPAGTRLTTGRTTLASTPDEDFSAAFAARAAAGEHAWHELGSREGERVLDLSRPVLDLATGGVRRGTVLARFSLLELDRGLERLDRWIIALSVVAGILGWAVVFFALARFVITPTHNLAEMAEKLGAGQLGVRSTIHRHDELGALAESLNGMAARLEQYTAGLEAAVHERTRALEEANGALERANDALGKANQELERLATTDGLTGLDNHRHFQGVLAQELRRAARTGRPVTLWMVDIDHFKRINDAHGHPAGDEILRAVAQLLRGNLRSTDLVARYGGEEFAVVLVDTPPEEGAQTAQKIATCFHATRFPGEEVLPAGKLTVSIGVASFPADAQGPAELVRAADLALYEAKRRGRDRIVRYAPELPQHTGATLDTPRL